MRMRGVRLAVCVVGTIVSPANAHVTLENRQAAVGSYYKAVFAIPHGCSGSATTKVRVQIPEGVIAVKPMPKPGWSVEPIKGKYAAEYELHGIRISEGVKEVVWSGGKLPDDNYDEFVMATYLTSALKPNSMLHFPVVQECEQGINRWIDIPHEGGSGHHHESKSPAPGLKLLPKP